MKNIFLDTLFIIAININGQNPHLSKTDSLFTYHLKSIDSSINSHLNNVKYIISWKDAPFLYMLSSLANFTFVQQGYTHQPLINRNELNEIKRWYFINKAKLNYKTMERYLFLFRKTLTANQTDEELDEISNEISNLKLFY